MSYTPVFFPIAPQHVAQTFPTHLDKYGKGGYRALDAEESKDDITYPRTKKGMVVFENISSEKRLFFLDNYDLGVNPPDYEWVDFPFVGDRQKFVFLSSSPSYMESDSAGSISVRSAEGDLLLGVRNTGALRLNNLSSEPGALGTGDIVMVNGDLFINV